MGLLDFASNVVTTYKADVGDHISELKKLKGEEKERAKALLDQQREINDRLESQIKVIGKVALVAGAAYGAARVAIGAFNEALDHSRLSAAAQGVSIEGLRRASLGLKTEMELLSHAAKLQTGEFKLSQDQMELVERAIVAYTRQGKNAEEATTKVLEAVTALKVDGLADFGTFVDKAGLSMDTAEGRAAILKATLAELAKVSGDVKEGQLSAAEGVQAAGVRLENAWDSLKRSLGELVIAFEPIISALAQVAEYAADIVDVATRSEEEGGSPFVLPFNAVFDPEGRLDAPNLGASILARLSTMRAEQSQRRLEAALAARTERDTDAIENALGLIGRGAAVIGSLGESNVWGESYVDKLGELVEARKAAREQAKQDLAALTRMREAFAAWASQSWESPGTRVLGGVGDAFAPVAGQLAGFGAALTSGPSVIDVALSSASQAIQSLNDTVKGLAQADPWGTETEGKSIVERMFGSLEQISLYDTALASLGNTLRNGLTAALTAWIEGSESAGAALQRVLSESAKSLAVESGLRALYETAWAISSAVTGNLPKAAGHALAAAKFGAVAAAAAIVAKSTHASSAGASSGYAGTSAPPNTAGTGQAGNTYVVVYGDPGVSYLQQRDARKLVTQVMGAPGVESA